MRDLFAEISVSKAFCYTLLIGGFIAGCLFVGGMSLVFAQTEQKQISFESKLTESINFDSKLQDVSLLNLKQGRQNSLDFLYAISH